MRERERPHRQCVTNLSQQHEKRSGVEKQNNSMEVRFPLTKVDVVVPIIRGVRSHPVVYLLSESFHPPILPQEGPSPRHRDWIEVSPFPLAFP